MKYIDEYRDTEQVRSLVRAIRKVVTKPWHIMEICGGQTHAIARYRLEEMLPEKVRLLHGPGCPVCVTPVGIIDRALGLAKRPRAGKPGRPAPGEGARGGCPNVVLAVGRRRPGCPLSG